MRIARRAFPALLLGCQAATGEVGPAAQPPSESAAPAELASEPLRLAPGEVVELAPRAAGQYGVRLATPSGEERFVWVVASAASGPDGYAYDLSLELEGPPSAARPALGCSLDSQRFRARPEPVAAAPRGEPPPLGQRRTLTMQGEQGLLSFEAEAISRGPHSVVWADRSNETELDSAFAESFRADFEERIATRARAVFGAESDIDGDGRIHLVFSPLTRNFGVAFFSPCDLSAPSAPGCAGSNRGEFLYLTPPNAIDPPYNTPSAIKEILSHELSHLLHFDRKVLDHRATRWQDGRYFIEGVGALSQDVTGDQAGNLYVTMAGLRGLSGFGISDLVGESARDPERHGVLRGLGYLFVRYLYDRAGADAVEGGALTGRGGPQMLRALLGDAEPVGLAFERVMGAALPDASFDFYTALAMSNRDEVGGAAPKNPCFAYLPTAIDPLTKRQRGANLFARFHGQQMPGPELSPAREADGQLRGGGADLLLLEARPAQAAREALLRVDPSAQPRVRVGRIQ